MTSTLTDRVLDQLLQRRIVVLGDEVTDESAGRVVSQLLMLSADDPEADISLHGFVDHVVTSIDQICPPHRSRPIGLVAGAVTDDAAVAS